METLATIDIDLDALAHNVRIARGLAGGAKIYGVVKGDAYGIGLRAAAATMASAGVDGFAAGEVVGATMLAARYPRLPVILYGVYEPAVVLPVARAGVMPTLFSRECIEAAAAANTSIRVFIEVDCGFGRLGLLQEDVDEALRVLAGNRLVKLTGVYTHLGAVEDAGQVARQTKQFRRIVKRIRQAGYPDIEAMAASSRVVIGYPEHHLDAVNPGRLLYGLLDAPWRLRVDARPVYAAVRSRLIQIKQLAPGARLGYGGPEIEGRGVVKAGVAAIGFAGGLARGIAGAPVLVRGRRARVLGLASMEHLLIDLEVAPDAAVGDEIVLLGRQDGEAIAGDEFSSSAGLTELELLPRLGRMLPRRYLRDGVAINSSDDRAFE
jgi:alanine racemase